LVFGVGSGTVAVSAFAVIGIVICFFKDCTPIPSVMVTIGVALPLLVLGIIYGLPKETIGADEISEED